MAADLSPGASPPGIAGASTPGLKTALRACVGVLFLSAGVFAVLGVVLGHGVADLRRAVSVLPAGLAASLAVHGPQVLFTAMAWRCLVPRAVRPRVGTFVLLRWFRESAMALLPAGAVVGQVAVARLLRRHGVPGPLAAATATMDVTVESVSQAVFTAAGLVVLLVVRTDRQGSGAAVFGTLVGVAGIAALVALQGRRTLLWAEAALLRWFPKIKLEVFSAFRIALAAVRGSPGALAAAFACHSTAWLLGSAEIVAVLALAGRPTGWAAALVVESLSQAMRIAGLFLPGAIGVQEGAILAASALVGVPPEAALIVALVRRARELAVAVLGLAVWAATERRFLQGRGPRLARGV